MNDRNRFCWQFFFGRHGIVWRKTCTSAFVQNIFSDSKVVLVRANSEGAIYTPNYVERILYGEFCYGHELSLSIIMLLFLTRYLTSTITTTRYLIHPSESFWIFNSVVPVSTYINNKSNTFKSYLITHNSQ